MSRGLPRTTYPDGRIDWIEAAGIIISYDITKAFLVFPQRMAIAGLTAAWTIPLFSALVSVLWVWPLVAVMRLNPGKNIIEITRSTAGRFVGGLAGVLFYLLTLGIGATGAREITSALKVVVFPLTPASYLMGLGLLITAYIASNGLEVIGRLSAISAVATVAVISVLALLSVRSWNFHLVYPLLGPGVWSLARSYVVRQSIYGEILALGIVGAYLRDPGRELAKSAKWCLAAGAFTLTLTVFVSVMVFPYPTLVRVPVPFLRVVRFIYLGRFFQRLDALFVVVWLAMGLVKVSIGHYLGAVTLASAFSLKTYKPLVIPLAVAGFAVALAIPDYSTAIILDFDIVRPYSTILLDTWPLGLFLLDTYRRRKKRRERGE